MKYKKQILIFTATYNEKDSIILFLKKLYKFNRYKFKLLILDDNSPDKTFQIIKDFKKKNNIKNLKLIIRDKKLGLDTANKYAFNYAKKKKIRYLITLDSDLSHDPKKIVKIKNLLKKYSFIIGSRYIYGGKNELQGFRFFLSVTGNKIIKFFFKTKINEFTTAFRGFDLEVLKKIDFNNIKSKGYSFFMEVIYYLLKYKYSIKEIPIIFKVRQHGLSKISKIEIIRTIFNLIRLKFKSG